MPIGSNPSIIPLGRLKGMPLEAIEVYQTEESLNLDIRLEDGYVLDLMFRVGFKASGIVLKWESGDSTVVRRVTPQRKSARPGAAKPAPETLVCSLTAEHDEADRVPPMTVAQLPTHLMFISDSNEVHDIREALALTPDEDFDSFFVGTENGDYTEVWGMAGTVPEQHRAVFPISLTGR